jgi:hypothetical protein
MNMMMTCKQVSTLMSTGELASAPLRRRLAVRLHLAMCSRCSAFKQWLDAMTEAAQRASRGVEHDAPDDLESRILKRLDRTER